MQYLGISYSHLNLLCTVSRAKPPLFLSHTHTRIHGYSFSVSIYKELNVERVSVSCSLLRKFFIVYTFYFYFFRSSKLVAFVQIFFCAVAFTTKNRIITARLLSASPLLPLPSYLYYLLIVIDFSLPLVLYLKKKIIIHERVR